MQSKKNISKHRSEEEQSILKTRPGTKSQSNQEESSVNVKQEHISPMRTDALFQVKTEQASPLKEDISGKKTLQQSKKPIKNISLVINEVEKMKAKKKKVKQIESDSDEEEPMETSIGESDVTSERGCIEIEVADADEERTNEIFIPPGKRILETREKPPSDIFLKELKKFCRETVLSGCLSLADLKEVLSVKQQGRFFILLIRFRFFFFPF